MINLIKKNSKLLVTIGFCSLFAFLICLLSPSSPFTQKYIGTDTWVFQYNAIAMKNGMLPYVDFFDHKGIILYFINLLGILINKSFGIWIIELIFMFFSIYFTKKTLDLFSQKEFLKYFITTLIMLLLVTAFEGGNTTEEYYLPFAIYSQFIFCKYLLNNKVKNIEVVLAGVSLAIVSLLRINMIGLWGAYLLIILIKLIKEKKLEVLFNYILLFILGLFIVFVPITLYMITNGIFGAFIESYFVFNFKYSGVTIWEKYFSFKYYVNIIIILIGVILNIAFLITKNKFSKNILIVNLIAFIINLIGISLSGKIYMHYAVVIIPNLIIPYIYLINYLEENEIAKFIVLGYLTIYILVPSVFSYIDAQKSLRNFDNTNYEQIAIYIKENTEENDKISIFGNKNLLYVLSERFSVSKYSYQIPLIEYDEKIYESYINDIITKKPKIVYMAYESAQLESILNQNNYVESMQNLYILQ